MNNEEKIAYTEVLEILSKMDERYVNKIPNELMELLKKNKLESYDFKLDTSIKLKHQKLHKKTLAIIAMLNLKYWLENEEEKSRLVNLYTSNEEKYQEELIKRYNPDDLFKKKVEEIEEKTEECKEIVKEPKKEKWYIKILRIFRK